MGPPCIHCCCSHQGDRRKPWQATWISAGPEALQTGSAGWHLAVVPLDALLHHSFSSAESGVLGAVLLQLPGPQGPSPGPYLICTEPCATKSN